MRPSGNCQQSRSEVESKAPILSHRKRSIDLVRQAQFAACSYLGFDPYEEKHRTALVHRQLFAPDGSVPLELHLHHHHHHNCWEAEDIIKKPSHIRASGDSSLAVENLLSICDQIHLFQDAWQRNIRVDEKSQKFMLQGSLIKRDATYAGFEGGMSLNPNKRNLAERNFTERCWSGGRTSSVSPITKSKVTGNEVQHINREARFSHFECRVVQEDKLAKGCDAGARSIGKGQTSSSDDRSDFISKNADLGWKVASKNEYPSYHPPSSYGWKADRNSDDSAMAAFLGSTRNSVPTVRMNKKSFSDVEASYDKVYSGLDSVSWAHSDPKIPNNQHQRVHTFSESAVRLSGMSPNSSFRQIPGQGADQDLGCNAERYDKSKSNLERISLNMVDKVGSGNTRKGRMFGCDGCTCQPSAQVHQEGFEVQMTVSGRPKDLADSLEPSNMKNRQYDPREKIIGLDENENGEGCNLHCIGKTNEKVLYKKLMVSEGNNDHLSASVKVSEECNLDVGNEARMQQWQCGDDTISEEMPLTRKLRSTDSLINDFIPIDKGHTRRTDKESYSDDSSKKLGTDSTFCSVEKAHSEDPFPTIHYHPSQDEVESQETRMIKSSMILHRGLSNKESHWECRVFDTPGNAMQVRERKKLDLELEARLAAEEKARKYETSAEVAEHRLLQLLEERTKLHRKFDEEVEQKEVERMHLNRLFEQEKRKSEEAKRELQELREKFALLLRKVPMSPRVVDDDDLHGNSTPPKSSRKISETLEKHGVTEKEKQSQVCMHNHNTECMNISKKVEQIEENMIERQMICKNYEPCIVQKVRLQEMQLTAVENAFQELERKVKQVDIENLLCAGVEKDDPQALRNTEKENDKHPSKDSTGLGSDYPQALDNTNKEIENYPQDLDNTDKEIENPPPIDDAQLVKDDPQPLKNPEKEIQTGSAVYEKFKSVYQSPIFEHSQSGCKSGRTSVEDVSKEDSDVMLQSSRGHNQELVDLEILQLAEEPKIVRAETLSHSDKITKSDESVVTEVDEKVEQMNELHNMNKILRRKLREKEEQVNSILAQNAKDLQKAETSCSQLHQLNKQLENNLVMSETRLSELQTDYNGLAASAASAESQLHQLNKQLECNLSMSEIRISELQKDYDGLVASAASAESQLHQLNKQLESNLAISETRLSELQKDYDGLVASAASAESQLKDAQKDVEELKRTAEELRRNLSVSERKVLELIHCAERKELQMKELIERVEELELKTALGEKEKVELSMKLDESRKEVDEQNARVAEYSSINEELLDFSQRKETEVTSMRQQLQTLQQHILEKTNVISKLEMELEKQQKEVNLMQRSYSSVESERETMKSKLTEKNIQLLQQEGTISTLTKQLEGIMEVRDSMLEEAAQFHAYLQNAKYKELEIEGKLRQSSLVINELEEKILWMDNDSLKAKMELANLKHQNSTLERLILEKEEETKESKRAVSDLKKKVQDLEEEVLIKEGQIAILSSQNGENYESF